MKILGIAFAILFVSVGVGVIMTVIGAAKNRDDDDDETLYLGV